MSRNGSANGHAASDTLKVLDPAQVGYVKTILKLVAGKKPNKKSLAELPAHPIDWNGLANRLDKTADVARRPVELLQWLDGVRSYLPTSIGEELRRAFNEAEADPLDDEPDEDQAKPPPPVTVCLATIPPKTLEWHWPGRVPLGKLTTFAGPGGLGKTFVTIDITYRTTTGTPWPDRPDEANPVGSVILISTEDDLEDTTVPRLIDAGADLTRVRTLTTDERSKFTLADLNVLERAIAETPGCRCVIIDPVTAHVGSIDDHKNAPLRALLAPLAEFANRHGVAVILVTHVNKSTGGAAASRVIGSVAYLNAVRAAWLFLKDKYDKSRRLLLPIKNNLGPEPTGLAYRIATGPPHVEWEPGVIEDPDVDAAACEGRQESGDASGKVAKAADWLEQLLAEYAMPSAHIFKIGKEAGFNEKNLYAAKKLRNIAARNNGFAGVWHWGLGDPGDWVLKPDFSTPPNNGTPS